MKNTTYVYFYTRHGDQPKHRPDSQENQLIFFKILGSNLVTCKVMRPDFMSQCSWEESLMEWVNLLWIDHRVVHCPTDEPDPTHLESSDRWKPHTNFFKPIPRFEAFFSFHHRWYHVGWVCVWPQPYLTTVRPFDINY